MTAFLAETRKALVAAAGAALAAYTTAATKGNLTQQDWALVVGSAIVAAVAVFLVPNRPPAVAPAPAPAVPPTV
jgi:hypothetical protein